MDAIASRPNSCEAGVKLERPALHDRTEYVLERVAGRRALSVGLGGKPEETSYSFDLRRPQDLSWTFSARIAAAAAATTFVDISSRAIEVFRPQVEASYHLIDITASPEEWPVELAETRCDVIVLGEVIEHLADPGAALRSLTTLLADGGEVVVTVPNAFNLSTVARLAARVENVHPEHVAYYSASTLTRLLELSGLELVDLGFYRTRPLHVRHALASPLGYAAGLVAERFPQYARGLVAAARPAP